MDLITNPVYDWYPSNIYYKSVDCNESTNQNIEWNYDPSIAIFYYISDDINYNIRL